MSDKRIQPEAWSSVGDGESATVHHPPTRRRRTRGMRSGGGVGELNLTSMIDVIFQLLIYFVVTASFMVDEGVLAARLPQGPGSPARLDELPPEKIVIRLTSDPADDALVSIERGPVENPIAYGGFVELAADLARLRYDPEGGSPEGIYDADNPVVIEPGRGVRWQHVVAAFNAAVAAAYENVSFADAVP
ncbi:MAG: biopolymer transporter ExbD [Planctomycetota bacterium]